MKAYVNESHYFLYLDGPKTEIISLTAKQLETTLQQDGSGADSGKK